MIIKIIDRTRIGWDLSRELWDQFHDIFHSSERNLEVEETIRDISKQCLSLGIIISLDSRTDNCVINIIS